MSGNVRFTADLTHIRVGLEANLEWALRAGDAQVYWRTIESLALIEDERERRERRTT